MVKIEVTCDRCGRLGAEVLKPTWDQAIEDLNAKVPGNDWLADSGELICSDCVSKALQLQRMSVTPS